MKYTKSPMNYIGGKYTILEELLPLFPQKINTFVDVFAGGLNVSVNVNANTIYANDQITYLIDIYKLIKKMNISDLLHSIESTIKKYNLSKTNTDGYNKLRDDYNKSKNPLNLFVLIFYSFNHQIRFNSKHLFNVPFGKNRSSFNDSIKNNLIQFSSSIKNKKIKFYSKDFRHLDYSILKKGDFVYCDPPYLITTGTYNDGKRGFNGWSIQDDLDLMELLDMLDKKNVCFALSNVLYHKGKENTGLIEWSKKYHIYHIDKSYSNCNYHYKNKNEETVEVVITNYEIR